MAKEFTESQKDWLTQWADTHDSSLLILSGSKLALILRALYSYTAPETSNPTDAANETEIEMDIASLHDELIDEIADANRLEPGNCPEIAIISPSVLVEI